MRSVCTDEITENIKEMCIEANHFLSEDMREVFEQSVREEKSPLGSQILGQLEENLKIAGEDMIPICQDTGMAVVFVKIGQEVHIEGGSLSEAIHEGVRRGYTEGFLRKSVVGDPIERINTKDNTPAVIHYEITEGDKIDITVAPKGFGSENEPGFHAEAGRRLRRGEGSDPDGSKGCRAKCLSAYGDWRRNRRNL